MNREIVEHRGAQLWWCALLGMFLSSASTGRAGDWPQFLGPMRSCAADASETVASSFPTTGPKIAWTKPLGTGFAGPVVAAGKVIIFHRVDETAMVEALDAVTGQDLWRYSYPDKYDDSFGFDNGPRASPTVAEGKVIVHGADGMMSALDLETGKLLWNFDTVAQLSSPQGFFGRVCAPLVSEGKVIFMAGGKNAKGPAGLVALSLADGKIVWQGVEDEASYAAPILRESDKGNALICWMRNDLVVASPTDGAVKSSRRHRSNMDASVNAATPVWCAPDKLFTTACYDVGATLWQWSDKGTLTKVWGKEDVLDCHYSTPVPKDGYLYGFHGRQEFGQTLRCIRAEDGKVMWESGRVPGGTMILVKDTLLVLTEAGELWMLDARPDKFNRHASDQLTAGGHRSYPAFANGFLYARDSKQLVAADLRP